MSGHVRAHTNNLNSMMESLCSQDSIFTQGSFLDDDEGYSQRNKRRRAHLFDFVLRFPPAFDNTSFWSTNLDGLACMEPIDIRNVHRVHDYAMRNDLTKMKSDIARLQRSMEVVNSGNKIRYSGTVRVYPKNGTSLGQNCSRAVRGALTARFTDDEFSPNESDWTDIDISSAAPTILHTIFTRNGIKCDTLNFYNTNRDDVFLHFQNNEICREAAKKLLIAIMNGKNIFKLDPGFLAESGQNIVDSFCETVDLRDPKDRRDGKKTELVINLKNLTWG